MSNNEIVESLQLVAREKGLDYSTLVEALEAALVSAYKRMPSAAEDARVTIEEGMRVWALELDEEGNVVREWDDTPKDFGRIAAQTAKQVLTQRLQVAERELKYKEYQGREGDIVTGIVQQKDQRYTLFDLGKVEALLPQAERCAFERYEQGARLKAYIVEVRKTMRGPQIVVSRTHPGLVVRLFDLEVPEIADGIVEIKAIAREPGARTKIAVASNDDNVDPVGACVGARGSRVRMVVNELRGEKVDIVPFSEDIREYVAKALAPAKVREVRVDEETRTAEVVVPDYQLSLAIGKEGQNARLAARLTGWRVDIRSDAAETEAEVETKNEAEVEVETENVVEAEDTALVAEGDPSEGGVAESHDIALDEKSQGSETADGSEDSLAESPAKSADGSLEQSSPGSSVEEIPSTTISLPENVLSGGEILNADDSLATAPKILSGESGISVKSSPEATSE